MESYLKAEISASAVRHNLSLLRGLLAPATKLCVVVKADCYGHGLRTLLGVIAEQADALAVATPEEAIALRDLGYERPILMFFSACAYTDGRELRQALGELIARGVTLTVVAEPELAVVSEVAQKVGGKAEVHVKIDTGMGRSGILPEKAPALIEKARRSQAVQLTGLYTHFAVADQQDKSITREQLACFLSVLEASGGRAGLTLHTANSAAAVDLPESHLDMIRPGIAVYGYQPSAQIANRLPLRPSLRLTGRLMQIKTLPAGSRCGYGLTYTFRRETRVGLVPVGYADGYLRNLSNRSLMRLRGTETPVRGRVSMDQVIIDLTGVPDAAVGEEVEIISPDPGAPNSVESLAGLAGTIPYEVTCRLGRRVRRVLVS